MTALAREQILALGRRVGTGRGDSVNKLARCRGRPCTGRRSETTMSTAHRERELSENAHDFIDDAALTSYLDRPVDAGQVRDIIAKSMAKQPLEVAETAVLVNATQRDLVESLFDAARQLKRDVYGNRIVLFAPLYVGNYCTNDCDYCGFRRSNADAIRRTLDRAELAAQVAALERRGQKRLILVFGEHPRYSAEFIAESVRTVYAVQDGHGEIRRVNINAAPMDHAGFRTIQRRGDRHVPDLPGNLPPRHVRRRASAGQRQVRLPVAAGCAGPRLGKRLR